jgi:chorismate mutase
MSLDKIRTEIDILDDQIISLLEKRLILATETIKYKKKIYDRKRENKILEKINNSFIQDIYKNIFKVTKKFISH